MLWGGCQISGGSVHAYPELNDNIHNPQPNSRFLFIIYVIYITKFQYEIELKSFICLVRYCYHSPRNNFAETKNIASYDCTDNATAIHEALPHLNPQNILYI